MAQSSGKQGGLLFLYFPRLQSEYRRGHSTETALLHVMNTVYAAANAKKITALLLSSCMRVIYHNHRTGWARHLGGLRHHRPRCACQLSRVTVRCCRRCVHLATVLSPRPSAVCASWQTLVSYGPVQQWLVRGLSLRRAYQRSYAAMLRLTTIDEGLSLQLAYDHIMHSGPDC